MPQTPTYGFEYETPQSKPGITLTGNSDGLTPILAEQVETVIAGVDSRLAAAEGDIAALQATSPSDTGWLAMATTTAVGFSAVSAVYRRWGPVTGIRVECERTGAAIVANSSGNVAGDPAIFTIDTIEARPDREQLLLLQCTLTSGGSRLGTNGVFTVTDLNSSSSIATNDLVRVSATYFVSTFS
jgi:hypothetical protein